MGMGLKWSVVQATKANLYDNHILTTVNVEDLGVYIYIKLVNVFVENSVKELKLFPNSYCF